MSLQKRIDETTVNAGELGLFYLAQAGFCFKTSAGKRIFIDPYLSDACERLFGFKRMIPAPISTEELTADLYLITHHHADHLDPDAMPLIVKKPGIHFIIAPDCASFFEEHAVPKNRYAVIREGESITWNDINIRAVYADHGELAPEAIGYLIEVDGMSLYHAGDTAFRPTEIKTSLGVPIDIMIAPINGTYGNMIAAEALRLAADLNPSLVIPCHFWMFLEHVVPGGAGDPTTFLREAPQVAPGIQCRVMAPGEHITYSINKD